MTGLLTTCIELGSILICGCAVGAAVAPQLSRFECVAWSMGLGVGAIGFAGIVGHWLHVDFRVVVLTMILVAAAIAIRRRASVRTRMQRQIRLSRWALISSATAGIASASMVVATMGSLPLPVSDDAPIHVQVASEIQSQHDVIVRLVEPAGHGWVVRAVVGFEAVTAVVADMVRQHPVDVVLPLTLIALLFFPLELSILTLEVTDSRWLATIVPWFTVGLLFPRVAVGFGEYPLVVDTLLVVPLLLGGVRWLRTGQLHNVALVVACVIAMMVIHGTEILTVAVFGIPLAAAVYWAQANRPPWKRLSTLVMTIGFAIVMMLQVLPHDAGNLAPGAWGVRISSTTLSVNEALDLFGLTMLPGVIFVGLYVAGVTTILLRRRQLMWLLIVHFVLLAALIDSVTGSRLFSLWLRLYPWSVPDRLLSLQYFAVPIIVAVGCERVYEAVRHMKLRFSTQTQHRIATSFVVAVCGVSAFIGVRNDLDGYRSQVAQTGVVGTADRRLIERLSDSLPSSSLILTDGLDDSGKWIPALTPLSIPMTKIWVDAHPDDWRIVALQNACTDPIGAGPALQDVQAVFVGSRRLPDAKHPWNTQCLDSLPNLKRIDSESDGGGTAVLYQVQH